MNHHAKSAPVSVISRPATTTQTPADTTLPSMASPRKIIMARVKLKGSRLSCRNLPSTSTAMTTAGRTWASSPAATGVMSMRDGNQLRGRVRVNATRRSRARLQPLPVQHRSQEQETSRKRTVRQRGHRPTKQGVNNLMPTILMVHASLRSSHNQSSFNKAAKVPASRLLAEPVQPTMGTETLQHDTAVSVSGRPKFPRLSGRPLTCLQDKATTAVVANGSNVANVNPFLETAQIRGIRLQQANVFSPKLCLVVLVHRLIPIRRWV